jgi:formate-dependent nitrite reductase cytochrome c552 subunit
VKDLTKLAKDQACVRCASTNGVVLCHYTGVRRLSFGGGFGIKVPDIVGAHMCGTCHQEMDQLSRDKAKKWEHSEEFEYYVLLTILRLFEQGKLTCGSSS